MIAENRNGLTEPAFYVLMALSAGSKSKVEVLDYVYIRSHGRVNIWPGTLYTLLDCFQESGMIRETETNSCGCTYALTERGRLAYTSELLSLCACIDDALDAAMPASEREAV